MRLANVAIIVMVTMVLAIPSHDWAIESYWTDSTNPPELIVVGTLSEVKLEALHHVTEHTDPEKYHSDATCDAQLSFYSTGVVTVEEVLLGDTSLAEVEVYWFSRRQAVHRGGESFISSCDPKKKPPAGERRIWVLWPGCQFEDQLAGGFEFQVLGAETRDRVIIEINQLGFK